MSASELSLPAARREALRLAIAQAVGGSIGPVAIGSGGLVGISLLPEGDHSLATVPVTAFIVGAALSTLPAALLMRRIGRRAGFMTGALVGAAGAVGSAFAIMASAFWPFTFAMLFIGAANAFGQQYRFAAADAAPASFKATAISWTLAGGVVTGVVGPQIAIHGTGLVAGAPYAGPFFAIAALLVAAALILSGLKVPPPAPLPTGVVGRPLRLVVGQPRFLTALVVAISSYALMSFVMTASPIAMIEHHHAHADAQLAIQWHVIAMFAPSFFTGNLITRFGKATVAAAGLILIALAAVVALLGTDIPHFWIALILLGIGWNFGFVAATAMVASLYRPHESFRVQAFNEFVLFGFVAVASFSSGKVLAGSGWETVNWIVFPVVGLCLFLIALEAATTARSQQAAKALSDLTGSSGREETAPDL